ncbi:fungal specific transcription factor [Phlyctema vagabunda]|uniref:Fungal specific transcription factor n=1 Tax=Phlyctema vagabunda TaxID=108571 RepID=A0ABR4PP67_9HELO
MDGKSPQTPACDRCRKRKTKCDWETPSCGLCIKHQAVCIYTPIRRAKRRVKASTRAVAFESRLIQMEEIIRTQGLPLVPQRPTSADKEN